MVLLAPPPKSKTAAEQRNVLVAAVDDPTRVYNYRSNWLERVPNLGLHHFGVGDKVQLDYGAWLIEPDLLAGKCLGAAPSHDYGIVCAVGPVRDGRQRNIQVWSAVGSRQGHVSLYPAHTLVLALRRDVLTPRDREGLAAALQELIPVTARSHTQCESTVVHCIRGSEPTCAYVSRERTGPLLSRDLGCRVGTACKSAQVMLWKQRFATGIPSARARGLALEASELLSLHELVQIPFGQQPLPS